MNACAPFASSFIEDAPDRSSLKHFSADLELWISKKVPATASAAEQEESNASSYSGYSGGSCGSGGWSSPYIHTAFGAWMYIWYYYGYTYYEWYAC